MLMNNTHVEFVTGQQHGTVELKLKVPLALVSWLTLGFVSPAGLGGGSGKGESPGEKEKGSEAGGHRGRCVWKGNKLLKEAGPGPEGGRLAPAAASRPKSEFLGFLTTGAEMVFYLYICIFPFFPFKSLRSVSFPYRGCRRSGNEGSRSRATLPGL